jgi:small subunit ribosomal protein SAe
MVNYVYKRNKDGIHYLDLAKTWEKLMVAARVIAATQAKNLKDVLVSNLI